MSKDDTRRPDRGKIADGEAGSKQFDVVLIHGVTPDGGGLEVLRRRPGRLEAGEVRSLRPGQPIHGEVVRLIPRREFPLLCDVETEFEAPRPPADVAARGSGEPPRKGPALVATENYRKNWDLIWNRSGNEPEQPN